MDKDKLLKKLAIKRLDYVYCRIQPSPISGVGLFAIRTIPKGTDPFNNSYMAHDSFLVDINELKNQPSEIQKLLEDYWPSNNNNKKVVPLYPNQIVLTNYLNYTDNNHNIIFKQDGKWETTREIQIGEELLENPKLLFDDNGNYHIRQITKTNYLQISSIKL